MPRPPSDIAERIVEAARGRFLREGVDGASLRRIAEDAGTNIGMVYYYFKTKDDLFLAVVDDAYQLLVRDLMAALAPDVAPERRFARVYQRIAALSDREFDVIRLILREGLISSARLSSVVQRFQQGHLPAVLQTLVQGVAEGRFDPRKDIAVMAASTATLGVLPQLLHRLVTNAGLPFAAMLPDRQAAAGALFHTLLFGIAGPALREEAARANQTDPKPDARPRRRR
jgi:AcrR family transcriptional regulator